MTVRALPATEALQQLDSFSTIIDARSEAEYALDHLPGAVNWPSLNDAQRVEIGTAYAQVSPFEAKKRGAAMVAINIGRHIEREVLDKGRDWQPLVYCWRGGKRSGALSAVLDQIGFRVSLVEGGYKAFRAAQVADLPAQAARLQYRVVCGPTGSGKTRLLHALAAQGAQVLDLEGLANHRSSVLGIIPGLPQPTQKRFDTLVWDRLRHFDASRPVYVESESKKVGNVAVPAALIAAMRAGRCVRLDLAPDERVALLMEDYAFFADDPALFCDRLDALTELRGAAVVAQWKALAMAGKGVEVVRELLVNHYDPGYAASIARNFSQYGTAEGAVARSRSMEAMEEVARRLVAQDG